MEVIYFYLKINQVETVELVLHMIYNIRSVGFDSMKLFHVNGESVKLISLSFEAAHQWREGEFKRDHSH